MKYAKKIAKNYSQLDDNLLKPAGVSLYERTKNAAALLIGQCSHFFASGKNCQNASKTAQLLNANVNKITGGDGDSLINLYGLALKAFCAYKKTSNDSSYDQTISFLKSYLISGAAQQFEQSSLSEDKAPFYSFACLNGLGEYLLLTKDESCFKPFECLLSLINKVDVYNIKDDTFDYLQCANGLALYASFTAKTAVNDVIAGLFDNYSVLAQSINYCAAASFNDKSKTSPHATAGALELCLALLKLTSDDRYRVLARRIWFNGMQFCQRFSGSVGTDSFTTMQNDILQVLEYEKNCFATPLYATGLKCYAQNKNLFEESGNVYKDRNGRYLMGDKMFAKDLSGFFGKDLIEIPTLTAFDKQTATQLKFKLLF